MKKFITKHKETLFAFYVAAVVLALCLLLNGCNHTRELTRSSSQGTSAKDSSGQSVAASNSGAVNKQENESQQKDTWFEAEADIPGGLSESDRAQMNELFEAVRASIYMQGAISPEDRARLDSLYQFLQSNKQPAGRIIYRGGTSERKSRQENYDSAFQNKLDAAIAEIKAATTNQQTAKVVNTETHVFPWYWAVALVLGGIIVGRGVRSGIIKLPKIPWPWR